MFSTVFCVEPLHVTVKVIPLLGTEWGKINTLRHTLFYWLEDSGILLIFCLTFLFILHSRFFLLQPPPLKLFSVAYIALILQFCPSIASGVYNLEGRFSSIV